MSFHRPLFFGAAAALATVLALNSCGGSKSAAGSPTPAVPPPPSPTGSTKLTVVVLVVDSLMPAEITSTTPNLNSLKTNGTFYAQSRSVFSAETIPNHVAMMTGVYPQRSGIPTNNFLDYGVEPVAEADLSVPEELTANTLFTWIKRRCVETGVNPGFKTGATLSKKYLFEIFQGDAANAARANRNPVVDNAAPDTHWDPRDSDAYIPAPDEHTPDAPTMQQALVQLPGADFFFVNLGDVDRSAHGAGQSARQQIPQTDTQVGQLITALQDADRWENTVLFLVSDHGMDYSTPLNFINVQPALTALSTCFAPMQVIDNGGTDNVYVTDRSKPLVERQTALRAARACLLGTQDCATVCPGTTRPTNAANIAFAWYTVDDPLDPEGSMHPSLKSAHPNLGDLVLAAAPGYRFTEPSNSSNPIPGNHGHPATLHNTLLVSGGSAWVKKGQVIAASIEAPTVFDYLPEQSENVDIAPTVAWLLGLNLAPADFPDTQGFDGRVLKEAFTQFDTDTDAASPTACGLY